MSCGTKAYWLLFEYLVVPHTIYLPFNSFKPVVDHHEHFSHTKYGF